ncbi:10063_t:CDS:2, partial [Ambispora gerdemannii]
NDIAIEGFDNYFDFMLSKSVTMSRDHVAQKHSALIKISGLPVMGKLPCPRATTPEKIFTNVQIDAMPDKHC